MEKYVLQVQVTYELRLEAGCSGEAEAKAREAFDAPQRIEIDHLDAVYDCFVESVSELTLS
jgi:hypothetical protein